KSAVLYCLSFTHSALYTSLCAPAVSPIISFFFSSRRRHTRSKRDWSSDVCSSDLLKAAYSLDDINGAVVMSVPQGKDIEDLNKRVVSYTENFMEFVGRNDAEIDARLKELEREPMASLPEFESLIEEVHSRLGEITVPLAVKYGGKDAPLYEESADHIYENTGSEAKDMKVYPNTGHLMTKGKDKKLLFKDILHFLDSIEA